MSVSSVKPLSAYELELCGLAQDKCVAGGTGLHKLEYVAPVYCVDLLNEILTRPQGPFAYLLFYPVRLRVHILKLFGPNPSALQLHRAFPFEDSRLVVEQFRPGYWYPRFREDGDKPCLGSALHVSVVEMLEGGGKIGLPSLLDVQRSYCYLLYFPPTVWPRVMGELGPVPLLGDVMAHPLRYSGQIVSMVEVNPGTCVHVGQGGYSCSEDMLYDLAKDGCRIGGDETVSPMMPGLAYLSLFSKTIWPRAYGLLGENPGLGSLLAILKSEQPSFRGDWTLVQQSSALYLFRGTSKGVSIIDLLATAYPPWMDMPVVALFVDRPFLPSVTMDEVMSYLGARLVCVDKPRLVAHQMMMALDDGSSDSLSFSATSKVYQPGKGTVGAASVYDRGEHLVTFLKSDKLMKFVVSGAFITLPGTSIKIDATHKSFSLVGRYGRSIGLEVPVSAVVLCAAVHGPLMDSREMLFVQAEAVAVLCAGDISSIHGAAFVPFPVLDERSALVQTVVQHDPVGSCFSRTAVLKSDQPCRATWGLVSWSMDCDTIAYSVSPVATLSSCPVFVEPGGSYNAISIDDDEYFDYEYDPTLSPGVSDTSCFEDQFQVLDDSCVSVLSSSVVLDKLVLPPNTFAFFSQFVSVLNPIRSIGLSMSMVRVVINSSDVSVEVDLRVYDYVSCSIVSVIGSWGKVARTLLDQGFLSGAVVMTHELLHVAQVGRGFSLFGHSHDDCSYLAINHCRFSPYVAYNTLGPAPTFEMLSRCFPDAVLYASLRRRSNSYFVVEESMGKLIDPQGKMCIVGF